MSLLALNTNLLTKNKFNILKLCKYNNSFSSILCRSLSTLNNKNSKTNREFVIKNEHIYQFFLLPSEDFINLSKKLFENNIHPDSKMKLSQNNLIRMIELCYLPIDTNPIDSKIFLANFNQLLSTISYIEWKKQTELIFFLLNLDKYYLQFSLSSPLLYQVYLKLFDIALMFNDPKISKICIEKIKKLGYTLDNITYRKYINLCIKEGDMYELNQFYLNYNKKNEKLKELLQDILKENMSLLCFSGRLDLVVEGFELYIASHLNDKDNDIINDQPNENYRTNEIYTINVPKKDLASFHTGNFTNDFFSPFASPDSTSARKLELETSFSFPSTPFYTYDSIYSISSLLRDLFSVQLIRGSINNPLSLRERESFNKFLNILIRYYKGVLANYFVLDQYDEDFSKLLMNHSNLFIICNELQSIHNYIKFCRKWKGDLIILRQFFFDHTRFPLIINKKKEALVQFLPEHHDSPYDFWGASKNLLKEKEKMDLYYKKVDKEMKKNGENHKEIYNINNNGNNKKSPYSTFSSYASPSYSSFSSSSSSSSSPSTSSTSTSSSNTTSTSSPSTPFNNFRLSNKKTKTKSFKEQYEEKLKKYYSNTNKLQQLIEKVTKFRLNTDNLHSGKGGIDTLFADTTTQLHLEEFNKNQEDVKDMEVNFQLFKHDDIYSTELPILLYNKKLFPNDYLIENYIYNDVINLVFGDVGTNSMKVMVNVEFVYNNLDKFMLWNQGLIKFSGKIFNKMLNKEKKNINKDDDKSLEINDEEEEGPIDDHKENGETKKNTQNQEENGEDFQYLDDESIIKFINDYKRNMKFNLPSVSLASLTSLPYYSPFQAYSKENFIFNPYKKEFFLSDYNRLKEIQQNKLNKVKKIYSSDGDENEDDEKINKYYDTLFNTTRNILDEGNIELILGPNEILNHLYYKNSEELEKIKYRKNEELEKMKDEKVEE